MYSVDPRNKIGERLRATGAWRPLLSDSLDDAAAADFVGDNVEARSPLWRIRVGVNDLALLLEVDKIGCVGDGGMALTLKTDSSDAVVARRTLRSAPNWLSHAG